VELVVGIRTGLTVGLGVVTLAIACSTTVSDCPETTGEEIGIPDFFLKPSAPTFPS